jgi:hypothetical protein
MSEVRISIDGRPFEVKEGMSVAAAVLNVGGGVFRRSVGGEPRAALCGMGICYECRLTIDGEQHVRSCQLVCRPGMEIVTA